jgi:hypothetical protein
VRSCERGLKVRALVQSLQEGSAVMRRMEREKLRWALNVADPVEDTVIGFLQWQLGRAATV